MGGRYLLSGSQLGTLIVLCKTNAKEANKQINKIVEEQYMWGSENPLAEDIKDLKEIKKLLEDKYNL